MRYYQNFNHLLGQEADLNDRLNKLKGAYSLLKSPNYKPVVEKEKLLSSSIRENEGSEKQKKALADFEVTQAYLVDLEKSSPPLSVEQILAVNALFGSGKKQDPNGKFGILANFPANEMQGIGSGFTVPLGYVATETKDMIDQLNKAITSTKLIEQLVGVAYFFSRFISIHPFKDGNGRTARALLNVALKRMGLPPAVFDGTEAALSVGMITFNYSKETDKAIVPITEKITQFLKEENFLAELRSQGVHNSVNRDAGNVSEKLLEAHLIPADKKRSLSPGEQVLMLLKALENGLKLIG